MKTFVPLAVLAIVFSIGTLPDPTPVMLAQQAPDRSAAPKPGPLPAVTVPRIQKRTLSNGLAVMDATETERAVLVSLSLGASASLHVAAHHPERVLAQAFATQAHRLEVAWIMRQP